jgi:hypothetical protein
LCLHARPVLFKWYMSMRMFNSASDIKKAVTDAMSVQYCKPSTLYNYVADIVTIARKIAKLNLNEVHTLRRALDDRVATLAKSTSCEPTYRKKSPSIEETVVFS